VCRERERKERKRQEICVTAGSRQHLRGEKEVEGAWRWVIKISLAILV